MSGVGTEIVERQGDAVEGGHYRRKARATQIVTILIPPPILKKVQVVFHLPVATNVAQEGLGRHRFGVEAGYEVAGIARNNIAQRITQFAINADREAAAWQLEGFADVVGVV